MEIFANLCGLLLIRKDLDTERLEKLKNQIEKNIKNDITDTYIGSPNGKILELIRMRLDPEAVTIDIYKIS